MSGKADTAGLDKPINERPLYLIGGEYVAPSTITSVILPELERQLSSKWKGWSKKVSGGGAFSQLSEYDIEGRDTYSRGIDLEISLPKAMYFRSESKSSKPYVFYYSVKVIVHMGTADKKGKVRIFSIIEDTGNILKGSESVLETEVSQKTTPDKLISKIISVCNKSMKALADKKANKDQELSSSGYFYDKKLNRWHR